MKREMRGGREVQVGEAEQREQELLEELELQEAGQQLQQLQLQHSHCLCALTAELQVEEEEEERRNEAQDTAERKEVEVEQGEQGEECEWLYCFTAFTAQLQVEEESRKEGQDTGEREEEEGAMAKAANTQSDPRKSSSQEAGAGAVSCADRRAPLPPPPPPQAVWPSNVRYINTVDRSGVGSGVEGVLFAARLPGVQVEVVKDRRHPCWGQRSLVAARFWPRYSVIGEYTGVMRFPQERENDDEPKDCGQDAGGHAGGDASGEYVAAVWKTATYTPLIDAAAAGNETRFINDFRNHPCGGSANCCLSDTYIAGRPALMVVVTSDILEGDEFLLDYGQHYWT